MTVAQANALAPWMANFADGADVQIVDPPYSPHVHKNTTSIGTGGRGARKRPLGFDACSPELMLRLMYFASRVRRWSIVFTDEESTHLWRSAAALHGVEYVRSVPWIRWSQPQLSGDRPGSGREEVMFFHAPRTKGDRLRWNGPGSLTHFYAKCLRGADKHPTEKPLDLMLEIVSYVSEPGELVIDPCAGFGTTGVAAALLGRFFVGLERGGVWAAQANARLCMAEQADLSTRDLERVGRFVEAQTAEASAVPAPKAKDGSDVKTFERAQRRLADVERILNHGE